MKTLSNSTGVRGKWSLLAVILVTATVGVSSFVDAADPPGGKKMQRDIRSMERVIDDMLVDSPNFLVNGSEITTGYYQPGTGAVFVFNTSLVSRWHGSRWSMGNLVFWSDDDDDDGWRWDDDEDWDDDEGKGGKGSRRTRSEEKLFERGKQEIIEVLLDYGDRMKEMKSGDWVIVVTGLRDARHFRKNKVTRLITKVKVDDLRAYGEDRLSEDAAIKKFSQETY